MDAPQGSREPRSAQAGDILDDRYRLGEVLGFGGTADVFQAVDVTLRREVAVKVFRPGATAVSVGRFCEEAVLLGRFTHPSLVAVYDAGRYFGGAYVVMQLVKGVTLRERLTGSRLTAAQAAQLCARLASALAHVHAAGIVHRDVKPSNVLLGPDDTPYLTDFGISRLIDESTRAEPGTVVGTVPYLAPEQVLGKGSSPASDVYALGLVLLEALKGEREYQGAPMEAGTARLLRSPDIPGWIPAPLASVIEAMTRTEPAERPDAARCDALLEAAADAVPQTVDAGADTVTHRREPPATGAPAVRSRPRWRRRRTVLAGTAAAIALSATGTMLVALDGGSAPRADTRSGTSVGGSADPSARAAADSPGAHRPRTSAPAKSPAHTQPSTSAPAPPVAGAAPRGRSPKAGGKDGTGLPANSHGKAKGKGHGDPAAPKKG